MVSINPVIQKISFAQDCQNPGNKSGQPSLNQYFTGKNDAVLSPENLKAYFLSRPANISFAAQLYRAENCQKTQIRTTEATYKRLADFLKQTHKNYNRLAKLDFGAGMGYGGKILKSETYEPFPRNWSPDYNKVEDINKKYDIITNLFVLNVIGDLNTRKEVVKQIGSLLKDGGEAYIAVRPQSDIDSIKHATPYEDGVLTSTGSFQKGFHSDELVKYVQNALGKGFEVEKSHFCPSAVCVVVKKQKESKETPKAKVYSVPSRSKEYGVGKVMGPRVYIHEQYEHVLKDNGLAKAKAKLPKDFDYQIVCYDKKEESFSFIQSPDFDTNPEPIRGDAYKVSKDGTVKLQKGLKDPQIYHHKWQFVMDNYRGFDVEESKQRTKLWTSLPDVDSSRIGTQSYWMANVVPYIPEKLGD